MPVIDEEIESKDATTEAKRKHTSPCRWHIVPESGDGKISEESHP
jgi:hypothetical protein